MPSIYEILEPNGHEKFAEDIFTKIKGYLDTHGVDSKVSKSGDTMTGNLTFNGKELGVYVTSPDDTDRTIRFMVGAGGENRGVYDNKLDKWIFYANDSDAYFEGTADNATKWSGCIYDIVTANTTDTWIPVIKDSKMQHTKRAMWTSVTHTNHSTNKDYLATLSCLSFWNGAYDSAHHSNLQYCDRGRFGTIVTKASGDYYTTSQINTKIPSNYRIRAGTVVKTITTPAGSTFKVFTQAQLNSCTGLTNRGQGNTVVWITNGDESAASGHMTSQGFLGNDYVCTFSVAYSSQLFRFNYIIIAW